MNSTSRRYQNLRTNKVHGCMRSRMPTVGETGRVPAQVDQYGSQILIFWSTLPEATTFTNFSTSDFPSPLGFAEPSLAAAGAWRPHARQGTKCECAWTVFTHRPVVSSQTRIV